MTARVHRQRTRVDREAGGCPSLQVSRSVPMGETRAGGLDPIDGAGGGSACLPQGAQHSFLPLPAENGKEHRRNVPGGFPVSGLGEVWSPLMNSSLLLVRSLLVGIRAQTTLASSKSWAGLPGYTATARADRAASEKHSFCAGLV